DERQTLCESVAVFVIVSVIRIASPTLNRLLDSPIAGPAVMLRFNCGFVWSCAFACALAAIINPSNMMMVLLIPKKPHCTIKIPVCRHTVFRAIARIYLLLTFGPLDQSSKQ